MVNLATHTVNFLKNIHFLRQFSALTLKCYALDLFQAYSPLGVPHYGVKTSDNEFFIKSPSPFSPSTRWNEEILLKTSREAQTQWAYLSSASRQRKSAALRSFLHFLYDENILHQDLASQLVLPPTSQKIPHFISVDEVLAVIKSLNMGHGNSARHLEDQYILNLVLLLYGGGLRLSEAAHLTWSQIETENRCILVKGKGGKERKISLPPFVIRELERLPRPGNYVFGLRPLCPSKAYRWVRKAGAKAGLLKFLHPHALRHSYATHLLNGGMDIRVLQELLGHSSLGTTQKYIHLSLENLARTMEFHHPLSKK